MEKLNVVSIKCRLYSLYLPLLGNICRDLCLDYTLQTHGEVNWRLLYHVWITLQGHIWIISAEVERCGSSAPPPQFTKLWKWWQNEATLPRKWVRYQHNFCTSSRTQRRRERGFHPFPCYQSCPRVKVVIWKRKIEEEGLLSPWWISPVIPSLRDYNAIQITVGIDDPCISTPSSSQVYDPRTIQSTIKERKPCVIWWRVPLRSSNCSITSCSGMKCTSLLQDTHFLH